MIMYVAYDERTKVVFVSLCMWGDRLSFEYNYYLIVQTIPIKWPTRRPSLRSPSASTWINFDINGELYWMS